MFRQPVEIQEAATAADGYGGQSVAWKKAFVWWADQSYTRGDEEDRIGRLASVETVLLTGRYDPRLTTSHRAVLDGKVLNIRSVQDRDGTRRRLTLACEAGVTT